MVEVSRETDNLGYLAIAHAAAGHEAEAQVLLEELLTLGGPPFTVAGIFARLGDIDAAFDWLERAVDANQGPLADLLVTPGIDALRSDPRWPALLLRAGFSEELIARAGSRS